MLIRHTGPSLCRCSEQSSETTRLYASIPTSQGLNVVSPSLSVFRVNAVYNCVLRLHVLFFDATAGQGHGREELIGWHHTGGCAWDQVARHREGWMCLSAHCWHTLDAEVRAARDCHHASLGEAGSSCEAGRGAIQKDEGRVLCTTLANAVVKVEARGRTWSNYLPFMAFEVKPSPPRCIRAGDEALLEVAR